MISSIFQSPSETHECMTVNLSPPSPPGNRRNASISTMTPGLLIGKSLIFDGTPEKTSSHELKFESWFHRLLSSDVPIPCTKKRLNLRSISDQAARPRKLNLCCVADIPPPPFLMTASPQRQPSRASSPAKIRSQDFRNNKHLDADDNSVKLPTSPKRCSFCSSCA